MANTYTQLFVHIVFSPLGRNNLISERFKHDIYKYMTGITKNLEQKPFIINGMPDHIHIFIGFFPDISISDLVGTIKTNTTAYIKKKKFFPGEFAWQKGFSAFSYSKSKVPIVINYIKNQKEYHRRKTFKDEYLNLLKKFDFDYKDEYLFEWYD